MPPKKWCTYNNTSTYSTTDSATEDTTESTDSVAVEDSETLPTARGNGGFENTVIDSGDFGTGTEVRTDGKWCLKTSATFENWDKWNNEDDKRFYWKTTSLQGYVELGVDDTKYTEIDWSYVQTSDKSFTAREGTQFAELVANETASLYQSIITKPGDILRWVLSHRARSGNEIMALFIGPMQEYSYQKATSGG